MQVSEEGKGSVYVIISAALWGMFPILAHEWAKELPPIFFGGMLSLFAALGVSIAMFARREAHELLRRDAYFPLFMVSICIVVIPNALFFIGASRTSSINASVLMLSEMIFTLATTPFFGEKNTSEKYIGGLGIMAGAAMVLYSGGTIQFNQGDLLIILSTVSYPIGNFYSKRSLYIVSPTVVIAARYFIGGIILMVMSVAIEPVGQFASLTKQYWPMLLLIGAVLLPLCKIAFYEGMKRLDISKSISLVMTYPFFSLVFLLLFFDTTIHIHQMAGVLVMIVGTFYAVKRKSVSGNGMRYAPQDLENDRLRSSE